MKVFWWQDGVHFEPETKEESRALALLLDSMKVVSISTPGDSAVCTSIFREQSAKVIAADAKL
jgi:hypothetical protein